VQQSDYIQRMIEQVGAAVARVMGLARGGQVEEAAREIDSAWSVLGQREVDVLRLDDATLRMMFAERLGMIAKLFEARAVVEEARGAHARAATFRQRSLALLKEDVEQEGAKTRR